MSCHSCGGCFTGTGCSTVKLSRKEILSDTTRFKSLLDLAAASPSSEKSDQHDHVIPTIMSQLSKNVYASQTVLFQAYDELSLTDFLALASHLHAQDIVGVHLAWAAEYCHGDANRLLAILSSGSESERINLVQHCNDSAEMHEMFGQLTTGSVGRVKICKEE